MPHRIVPDLPALKSSVAAWLDTRGEFTPDSGARWFWNRVLDMPRARAAALHLALDEAGKICALAYASRRPLGDDGGARLVLYLLPEDEDAALAAGPALSTATEAALAGQGVTRQIMAASGEGGPATRLARSLCFAQLQSAGSVGGEGDGPHLAGPDLPGISALP